MSRTRRAPLPDRDGLGPARVRLRGSAGRSGATPGESVLVVDEMTERFGPAVRTKVLAGEVVCADGTVVTEATVLPLDAHVYLYRDLPDEVPVPFDLPILYRDEHIVVVDKPHFLATMPRGSHVVQTALVRLRRELDAPELSPAHRLDRLTAGVLLFTTRREVRGAYQTMFARGEVRKTYLARAAVSLGDFPLTVRSRIIKRRGRLQAVEEPGEPNAETMVEQLGDGLYRLTPKTGRTHQLRVHMASLGLALVNDPLYPSVIDMVPSDFSRPLQLLAHTLAFEDPISGGSRAFVSTRTLSHSVEIPRRAVTSWRASDQPTPSGDELVATAPSGDPDDDQP